MSVKFRFFYSLTMSLALSFLMSAWVTFLNLGLQRDFTAHWMHAFLLAWPTAFTIAFAMGPTVNKITEKLIAASATLGRKSGS
ncbi:DUF2798 domain-containing protein [Hahella aquimaris]|uniref:DUF2798 domain-containing protein n=1 Tax=Hahella sp. HNIBRBA332 TaxID=3015983 RepID=UPI00273C6DE1|nr:DUF2798 domain-containing protein [Hahella sp. HNIBRBA332]WLQ17122.1 DUF2798 domain-containing protein [Hahella sp. HNIBRBA332]